MQKTKVDSEMLDDSKNTADVELSAIINGIHSESLTVGVIHGLGVSSVKGNTQRVSEFRIEMDRRVE